MHASGSFGWADFPIHSNFPLTAEGPATKLFLAKGAKSFADALRLIAHLPYGRNAVRNDPFAALREGRGTCSTKHALLKLLTDEHSHDDVRLMLGLFRMKEENTPGVGAVIKTAGLDYVPEAHVYLRIGGAVVDCTTARSGGAAFLADLLEEEEIAPAQTGAWKVERHQAFMDVWRAENFSGTLDELWMVREACIAALTVR